jgi:hypothetical protein
MSKVKARQHANCVRLDAVTATYADSVKDGISSHALLIYTPLNFFTTTTTHPPAVESSLAAQVFSVTGYSSGHPSWPFLPLTFR